MATHTIARKSTDEILADMSDTFLERNKVYGDNYLMVGRVMRAFFPNGVALNTEEDYNRWHLFELVIVKLTRFVVTGLTHKDSVHDTAVYSAMIEAMIDENTRPINNEFKNNRTQQ